MALVVPLCSECGILESLSRQVTISFFVFLFYSAFVFRNKQASTKMQGA